MKNRSLAELYPILSFHTLGRMTLRYLSLQDIGRLHRINREFRNLSLTNEGKLMLIDRAWHQLMYYLFKADWDRSERILDHYPDLIFTRKPVLVNEKSILMSPLQYVVYLVDNHGLEMCLKYITSLDSCELYWKQIAEVNFRYNFSRFLNQYRDLMTPNDRGRAQANLLPMWVLIEQCTPCKKFFLAKPNYEWNTTEFNDPRPKGECIIELVEKEERLFTRKINIRYQEKSAVQLGQDFMILRESNIREELKDENGTTHTIIHNDSTAKAVMFGTCRFDRQHISTLNIYYRLIKYREHQQTRLIFSMVDKQKSLKSEMKQLHEYIDGAIGTDGEGFDTTGNYLRGINRGNKIRAAQTKIRVIKCEISAYHLTFFRNELETLELTPQVKAKTPTHVLKELMKLKQAYMSFTDECFLNLLIERVLRTRWTYTIDKEVTFFENYNYIVEIVNLMTDRLIKVTDSTVALNFLRTVKQISDEELKYSGREANSDHCIVSLFITAMPAAFNRHKKKDFLDALRLANRENVRRLAGIN